MNVLLLNTLSEVIPRDPLLEATSLKSCLLLETAQCPKQILYFDS